MLGHCQLKPYEHDGISNHQRLDCLLNRLFRPRSEKTSKLRVTGLCEGNSPVTGEFPTQRASNAENVSLWWCHHVPVLNQQVWLISCHGDMTWINMTTLHFILNIHSSLKSWTEPTRASCEEATYNQQSSYNSTSQELSTQFTLYCSLVPVVFLQLR